MAEPADSSWFESALRGDPRAVDSLLAAYVPRLRAFVRARMDAELRRRESDSDIVQSVCRQVLAQPGERRFDGEAQFRAWLFTAALNKIREKYRFHHMEKRDPTRESPESQAGLEELHRAYASIHTPSRAAAAREEIARLEAALDRLTPEQREAVALARLADLPHAEVAAHMGKTVGAVRKLLSRALHRLSREL